LVQTALLFSSEKYQGNVDTYTMEMCDAPYQTRTVANATSQVILINNVCRNGSPKAKYSDWYSWLPYAKYGGQQVFNGTMCDVWELSGGAGPYSYSNLMAVRHDNNSIPQYFSAESSYKNTTSRTQFTYIDFLPNQQFSSDFFDIPWECAGNGRVCQGSGVQVRDDFVRFHEPNNYDLANQNVGDVLGDATFLCSSLLGNLEPAYQWVSQFQVQVNTSWGNYGLCNFGNCWGLNQQLVGREASSGIAPLGGQCARDTAYGVWYSMPALGQCAAGQSVGDNGCTWKTLQRLKTIDSDCLVKQHDFLDVCEKDGCFPFSNAAKILQNALDHENPALGGCPFIDPPSSDTALTPSLPTRYSTDTTYHTGADALIDSLESIRQMLDVVSISMKQ
jgi:hypothetical protein